jgi:thiol-disulfide isomerase/thioredoxin
MDSALSALSLDVSEGLIALVAALAAATVFGVVLRRRAGRFRVRSSAVPGPGQRPAGTAPSRGAAALTGAALTGPAPTGAALTGPALTEADLGAILGAKATLVQFSTAFCAPCRPTRQILAQVAGMVDGVAHVEIDAASRLDLVRRLRINSTPTVLVLGPDGAIVNRAVGAPRKADVIAALGPVIARPAGESDSRAKPE